MSVEHGESGTPTSVIDAEPGLNKAFLVTQKHGYTIETGEIKLQRVEEGEELPDPVELENTILLNPSEFVEVRVKHMQKLLLNSEGNPLYYDSNRRTVKRLEQEGCKSVGSLNYWHK